MFTLSCWGGGGYELSLIFWKTGQTFILNADSKHFLSYYVHLWELDAAPPTQRLEQGRSCRKMNKKMNTAYLSIFIIIDLILLII